MTTTHRLKIHPKTDDNNRFLGGFILILFMAVWDKEYKVLSTSKYIIIPLFSSSVSINDVVHSFLLAYTFPLIYYLKP